MPTTAELFDLARVPEPLRALLDAPSPWQVLDRLDAFASELPTARLGRVHPTAIIEGPLYLGEGASIGPYAYLQGPVYVAPGAQIGHAAYLRGPVVLGPDARVLHASEVKRSVLLAGARAPHFNYVGDSVIGSDVNLGAGVKLANFKTTGEEVKVAGRGIGVRKFGAALGDGVSIGCNAVLAPGTIVGRGTIIYNGAMVRGVVGAHRLIKLRQTHEDVEAAPRGG